MFLRWFDITITNCHSRKLHMNMLFVTIGQIILYIALLFSIFCVAKNWSFGQYVFICQLWIHLSCQLSWGINISSKYWYALWFIPARLWGAAIFIDYIWTISVIYFQESYMYIYVPYIYIPLHKGVYWIVTYAWHLWELEVLVFMIIQKQGNNTHFRNDWYKLTAIDMLTKSLIF